MAFLGTVLLLDSDSNGYEDKRELFFPISCVQLKEDWTGFQLLYWES